MVGRFALTEEGFEGRKFRNERSEFYETRGGLRANEATISADWRSESSFIRTCRRIPHRPQIKIPAVSRDFILSIDSEGISALYHPDPVSRYGIDSGRGPVSTFLDPES